MVVTTKGDTMARNPTKQAPAGPRAQKAHTVDLHTLGRRVPNLVLVWDSETEKKPEFRIQLEVVLDDALAHKVAEHLWGTKVRTSESIEQVRRLVSPRIDGEASNTFRDIVNLAFDDNKSLEEKK